MKCNNPIRIKNKWGTVDRIVKCGKCIGCTINKVTELTLRTQYEMQKHKKMCFITLTYDTPYLPFTENFESLSKRDMQLFFKRLRKNSKAEIKTIYCGEYGEEGNRPHYHAIILGIDKNSTKTINIKGKKIKVNQIDYAWQKGFINYGSVTPASIRYTIEYMLKERNDPKYKELHIQKPFYRISKNMGQGIIDIEKLINDGHMKTSTGNRTGIPKCIKDKYGIRAGEKLEEQMITDMNKALKNPEDLIKGAQREKTQLAKQKKAKSRIL